MSAGSGGGGLAGVAGSAGSVGGGAGAGPGAGRVRHSVELLRPHVPAAIAPMRIIRGLPPVVAHRVLNDRRHVLTRDAEGGVELWDVMAGWVLAKVYVLHSTTIHV